MDGYRRFPVELVLRRVGPPSRVDEREAVSTMPDGNVTILPVNKALTWIIFNLILPPQTEKVPKDVIVDLTSIDDLCGFACLWEGRMDGSEGQDNNGTADGRETDDGIFHLFECR
jgi:hypothetical protein